MKPGDRLRDFCLLRPVSTLGGLGVFVARDEARGREVLVKTCAPSTGGKDTFSRFLREGQVCRALRHPRIAALLTSGVHEGTHFLVFEPTPGPTLEALLRSTGGPLGPERAVALLDQVLDGLGFAHAQGVVHRNLHPGNVVVGAEDQAKILDFGLASREDSLLETSAGTVLGTSRYVSPEQNEGGEVDGRSDLYSAGLLFFEMLTGQPALRGKSLLEILESQHKHHVPLPSTLAPQVPPALDTVCAKLVRPRPADRFAKAEDARAQLRAFITLGMSVARAQGAP